MAHNPSYKLAKIEEVQRIYRTYTKQGVTGAETYRRYIKPVYHISQRTLTNYLSVNVALERKKFAQEHDNVNNDLAQN